MIRFPTPKGIAAIPGDLRQNQAIIDNRNADIEKKNKSLRIIFEPIKYSAPCLQSHLHNSSIIFTTRLKQNV
ncbi:hypothetical protein Tco_0667130 [Tanacetum coccineum]